MKLSVSTLGCPDWSLGEVIERVSACGFDGIDFRGVAEQIDVTAIAEFISGVAETRSRLEDAGLAVSALSSSANCLPKDETARQGYLDEMKRYCELAAKLDCVVVRVFGGSAAEGVGGDEALKIAAENLRAYGQIAADFGVMAGLETHDDWCASKRVAELMDRARQDAVGVLWDVWHPWRTTGELPVETFANFGRRIIYTHFKDARRTGDGSTELCTFGQGDIPLADCVNVLRDGGYEGWLTFEHEKRWHKELDEPAEAFARYVEVMRRLI